MTEHEMRNILRMMSYPEWTSFQSYVESLEALAISKFKKANAENVMHQQQGVLQTTDAILGLRETIKGRLTNG